MCATARRSCSSAASVEAQIPVALITARVAIVDDSPVSSSVIATPSGPMPVARTRVSTDAPWEAAVRATATTRRASSVSCPSCISSAPRSPSAGRPGASSRARAAEMRRGGGSSRRGVRAARRRRSPATNPAPMSIARLPLTASISGSIIGSPRTRCGAICVSRRPRSTADSCATATSPVARYRSPPCASLELQRLVPKARSRASISTVRRPREAASKATPAPVMPPPITTTSSDESGAVARSSSARRRPP